MEMKEKCLEELEKLTRDNRDPAKNLKVKMVKVYVKNLSEKSGLDPSVVIEDTPGVTEHDFFQLINRYLRRGWGSSIAVVVVDTNCGTLKLESLYKILRIFKDNECTERVIFVFTKVFNQIKKLSIIIK